jgi:DNA-binding response OmpR family regulator
MKYETMSVDHSGVPDFTVAIVEDEPVLRQELAFQLTHHGYVVQSFADAAQFYRYLATRPRTIAVLDIGLRGEDGLSICQYLREHDQHMGIVFVTARSLRADRLAGLEMGADAYLVKPVDTDELVLILKRLALRFTATTAAPIAAQPNVLEGGQWQFVPGSGFLVAPNGGRIRLSVNEGQLLRALAAKAGAACTEAELAMALGLLPEEHDKHRTEVIISRLRAKVEREAGVALPLHSVRSVGYRLVW